ncbi:hypothetical protein [Acinetobacter haemolyticus]|uniref:hypothetical protein n=1 Tax=Acinetobacter haemolyticus TaxID=29430 RepID=UPI00196B2AFB|nr:hypothetical protein [Acinetobacter haemolyticus]
MKKYLIPVLICCSLVSIACSSSVHDVNAIEVKESKISPEDQLIIQKYKDRINNLDLSDRNLVDATMKKSLSEISKIQNKREREKIEMNIYLSTGMYQEAYNLNTKILKENLIISNLLTQCELIYVLKLSKKEFQKCHTDLASAFKQELKTIPKSDPEYSYSEWGYLLSMYKAGREDYKPKLEKFINSTKDEQMKFQLQSAYELAIEQKKSI